LAEWRLCEIQFEFFFLFLSQQQWIEMVGEATLNTILRLHVGVQLCKDSQKSSRVNLQKSDVQPKPIQYSKHCIGRDVVKGGKKGIPKHMVQSHARGYSEPSLLI
jgi:hypothetical protein